MEEPSGHQAKLDSVRAWIGKTETWPRIKDVIMARPKSTELAARERKPSDSEQPNPDETRFFVSSLTLSTMEIMTLVVKRWAAETPHWHFDMAFCEDGSKICHGHAPENLSTLRKIARDFALPQANFQKTSVSTVTFSLQHFFGRRSIMNKFCSDDIKALAGAC